MCGLAGEIGSGTATAAAVLARLQHRGPDATSHIQLPEVDGWLGHTRLAIIDLDPRSNQPFRSEDGKHAIVFNGEIYNFHDLREILRGEGDVFKTESDTEVLLKWLISRGSDGIKDLDGMFAFALWNRDRRSLLCARDHIGEKPFYYSVSEEAGQFGFCSEIKGLLQMSWIDRTFNRSVLGDYLRFLYTVPPHTFYAGIQELPPGHWLEWNGNGAGATIRRYYDLEEAIRAEFATSDETEAYRRFRVAFQDSVRRRLISDVPVCIYLSGGLDSTAILSNATAVVPDRAFQTFTISYGGSKLASEADETQAAKTTSDYYGAQFQAVSFSLDQPFLKNVERVVELFDQPFGNSTAVVSDLLAGEVSKDYRVALVGDGGDEVAVGYPRYKALAWLRRLRRVPRMGRRVLAAAMQAVPARGRLVTVARRLHQFADAIQMRPSEAALSWVTYLSNEEVEAAIGDGGYTPFCNQLLGVFERNDSDSLTAAALVDLLSFVPFNLMQSADRTSMAHSLELRSPFLSTKIVQFALAQTATSRYKRGEVKPLIGRSMGGSLPKHVLGARKKPFNPPIHDYVRSNLDTLRSYLLGPEAVSTKVVSTGFLEDQLAIFDRGVRDNSTLLWGLATLECWLRKNWDTTEEPYRGSADGLDRQLTTANC